MMPRVVRDAMPEQKDFFISYTHADRRWAEWIAWQLEAAGYTTVIQAWDFRPGGNFVIDMHEATKQAQRTIAVLSPDYFASKFTPSEWAEAFRQDPTGERGLLLPVRVHPCDVEGLFGARSYIDLVNQHDEEAAKEILLKGIQFQRQKPSNPPPFPPASIQASSQPPSFPGALPAVWTVPYQRNPFFTGREQLIEDLHTHFQQATTATLTQQPTAVSGLGGVGKTQIAVEYAYRYREEYLYILWVNAATTIPEHGTLDKAAFESATLEEEYRRLARILQLPEQNEQDIQVVVQAVKHWLDTHERWLLIFDNVEHLEPLEPFLPTQRKGYLLMTTRDQATSWARNFEVHDWNREDSLHFLMQRSKYYAIHKLAPDAPLSQEEQEAAEAIVEALGGLPLALDQAGAYIEERRCLFATYLKAYQRRQKEVLSQRGRTSAGHTETVATTWSLSCEQIQKDDPRAADLLYFLAFLAPDAIPEELILKGASELGPHLQAIAGDETLLDEAIGTLLRYSLIQRDAQGKQLFIHRLVQAVLKMNLSVQQQEQWAEQTVKAVARAFPDPSSPASWGQCEQYLPHALNCAVLTESYHLYFVEGAYLLNQTGGFLSEQARYTVAEPLLQRTLTISEQLQGPEHSDTARCLNNLALLYYRQGKFEQAEPLYLRALTISERVMGTEHPNIAISLDNLALLYHWQGKFEQAEPLYLRALVIWEQVRGPEHPDTATCLNNLAVLYKEQEKYEQAEPLLQRALAICEQVLGPAHPDTALSLNNLAALYYSQCKYEQAEPLYQRALAIYKQVLGPTHRTTRTVSNNYALLLEEIENQRRPSS